MPLGEQSSSNQYTILTMDKIVQLRSFKTQQNFAAQHDNV